MKNVILYSNNCPKCQILKNKLVAKGVEYNESNDVELMIKNGFLEIPKLEVDGIIYSFAEAVKLVNNL